MRSVSKRFQAEMRKTNRNISVDGTIFFGEDLEAHHIPEEAIVENSLTIVDQLNNGKFGYGSVYTQNLSVKLDYTKCRDVDGKNINLTNGQIRFWFYVHYDDGTEEYINIGDFLIDSARSSRQGDILSIYGSSHMSKLDVPSEAMENVTPYQIYVRACELAGIRAAASEETVSAFPNGNLRVSFDTSQIQTARDMVMWAAELTASYVRAVIVPPSEEDDQGLYGIWAIDLVQSPTKYTQAGTTENFDLDAFKADNGTIIPADTRFKTEFTDTSVRVTTVIMNINGKQIKDHGVWTFAPDTLEGTMEIKSNPLLKSKTDSEIENAIYLLRDFTDDLRFCPFKTTFNGNPAIECGDYVYLEPGGSVDETNFRHYGIVTYSKWTYPYTHEIRCATDVTTERPETTPETSTMRMAKAAPRNSSESVGIQPKSQLDKRIDAINGQINVINSQLIDLQAQIDKIRYGEKVIIRGYASFIDSTAGQTMYSTGGSTANKNFAQALAIATGWQLQADGLTVLKDNEIGVSFESNYIWLANNVTKHPTDGNFRYTYGTELQIYKSPSGAVAFGFGENPNPTFMMTKNEAGENIVIGIFQSYSIYEFKKGEKDVKTFAATFENLGTGKPTSITAIPDVFGTGNLVDAYYIISAPQTPTAGKQFIIGDRYVVVSNEYYVNPARLAMTINVSS